MKIYKKVIAKYDNGREKYVVVDEDYNIEEACLIYAEELYSSYKLNTIDNYLGKVVRFLNYLESKNLKYSEVTRSIIPKYINHLKGFEQEGVITLEKRREGATINGHLTAIGSFYNILDEYQMVNNGSPIEFVEGHLPNDMYKSFMHHAEIRKGKGRKRRHKASEKRKNPLAKHRKYKTKDEIETFRLELPSKRDVLIFDILYETGMRIGELLNLTVYDFSEVGLDGFSKISIVLRNDEDYPNLATAKVRQPKTEPRDITVYNELIERLDEYVLDGRPYVPGVKGEEFIFVSHKGNKGEPLTRAAVEKVFNNTSKKSGVKITPHMLRHTHITELEEGGFDPLFIQLRAGHSNPKSTDIYKHPSYEIRAEAYKRFYSKKDTDI